MMRFKVLIIGITLATLWTAGIIAWTATDNTTRVVANAALCLAVPLFVVVLLSILHKRGQQ